MNPNPIPRVSLAFVHRGIAVLLAFARNVVAQMTANPNFATPVPALATVTTAIDALQAANEAASEGSHEAILDRRAKKASLIALLRQLAAYVATEANGSRMAILSSGFHTTKIPAPVGPLPTPDNLRLSQTNQSGQLLLRMNRVYGVTAGYTVQTAEAEEGPYSDYVTSSKTHVLIEGLTPAKTYWVRACANGAEGPSGWSNAAKAIAV